MAFIPSKSVSAEDVKYAVVNNSAAVTVGCTLEPISGSQAIVTLGTTQDIVIGVVLAIVGDRGKVLELNSKTVAADNLTVGKIKVAYIPTAVSMNYVSDLDAAAETTTNSSGFGHFSVDSTGLLVDESTWAASAAVAASIENMQVQSYGLTGKDTTQVEVRFINTGLGYNIA